MRVCHTLLNRNGSYISEDSMKAAMPSLKYSPLLANIHQLDDGSWDFHSHDYHIETDENGNEITVYDENRLVLLHQMNLISNMTKIWIKHMSLLV